MARIEGDSWDLASSVGATATAVAAQRAAATRRPDPLINDPFAEPLVAAVGVDFYTKLARGELAGVDSDDPAMDLDRMTDNMAVRTRYFDEFFLHATAAGIRQVVILAAGLDARAYRLSWQAGTVVFEIDQPMVIAFKTQTLAELGVAATADHRPLGVDLRDDWPAALGSAGFDPDRPTAWLTEGLFGYLPPDAQDRLLDDITRLSAAGSRLGTERVASLTEADRAQIAERGNKVADRWREHGYDHDPVVDLLYFGERNETAAYLNGRGWATTASTNAELFAMYGLPAPDVGELPFGDATYITATIAGA